MKRMMPVFLVLFCFFNIGLADSTSLCPNNCVDVGAYPDFNQAVSSQGNNVKTLAIEKETIANENIEVSTNITLWFVGNGILNVESGIAVEIYGPIQAEPRQIFNLQKARLPDGKVVFANVYNPNDIFKWAQLFYNTHAVQAAFDSHRPVKFARDYFVTTVKITGGGKTIDFDGYKLSGWNPPVNTNALLEINANYSVCYNVRVDANFHVEYGAAIWWYSVESGTAAMQNTFYGMRIDNTILGLAFGGFPGSTTPVFDTAQSENTAYGFRTRGTQRPIYFRRPDGRLYLVSPIIQVSRNEWDPSVFNYANSYCFDRQPLKVEVV